MANTTKTELGTIEDELGALREQRRATIEAARQERETAEFASILDYWAKVLETAEPGSPEYSAARRAEADLWAAIKGHKGTAGVAVQAEPAVAVSDGKGSK